MKSKSFAPLLALFQLIAPVCVHAHPLFSNQANAASQPNTNSSNHSLNLNLSSTKDSVSAGAFGINKAVTMLNSQCSNVQMFNAQMFNSQLPIPIVQMTWNQIYSLLAMLFVLLCSTGLADYASAQGAQKDEQTAEHKGEQKGEQKAETNNKAEPARQPRVWIRVSPRRCNLLVFTRPNQGIAGKFASADDTRISATQGTVFSVDSNTTMMHNGSVYLSSKKGTASIMLASAQIQVGEGLSILLELTNNSRETHLAVFGNDTKAAVVLSSRRGKKTLSLHPGQYISMARGEFDEQSHDFAQSKSDFQESALALMKEQSNQSALKDRDAPLHIFGSGGSEFSFLSPNTLFLRKGEIFTQVPDQFTVKTNLADFSASRNALIAIETNGELLRSKSFCPDGHPVLSFAKQQREVLAGQEILLCTHKITNDDLIPPDGVGRRDSKPMAEAAENIYGSVSDFSISSFLNEMNYLQPVKNAFEKEEKKIRDKILKTAIALQTATASHGPYRAAAKTAGRGETHATPRGRSS